jgi:acyl-CoA synthetase (AMP-forming)/AMP-acid ligase II
MSPFWCRRAPRRRGHGWPRHFRPISSYAPITVLSAGCFTTTPLIAELGAEPGPAVLRTGDQALHSADGLFCITGRMSRFIKVFGNRIGLDEVETICGAAGFSTIATG